MLCVCLGNSSVYFTYSVSPALDCFFQALNNKRQSNPDQVIPESSWATKRSLSLEKPFFSPFESIIVLSCPFLELWPFRTLLATLGFKIQLRSHLRILSILKPFPAFSFDGFDTLDASYMFLQN